MMPASQTITFQAISDLPTLEQAWRQYLAASGQPDIDPFSLPAYVLGNRHMENGKPVVMTAVSEWGAIWYPVVLRELPAVYGLQVKDVISQYGFGGPLIAANSPENRQKLLAAFEQYWSGFCGEHQIVAELIRFNPVLKNQQGFHLADCHHVKDIVWFDLVLSEDELRANLHSQKRRYLKKLDMGSSGLTWSEDWQHLGAFKQLYAQSMQEKSADGFYHFPDVFFDDLVNQLSVENCWLHTVLYEGRVISAALFLLAGDTVHYFLGANDAIAKNLHASAWVLWKTALKAKSAGYQKYTLGGGLQKDDSLFRFKQQLSPLTLPYHIGTRVWQPDVYQQLKATWHQCWSEYGIEKSAADEAPLFFYRALPPEKQ